jgi:hypothetical protein
MKLRILVLPFSFLLQQAGFSQNSEKIFFNNKDSVNDYYLVVRPLSGNIKGVQVLFCSFDVPESMLPETKLHNVACTNDMLTVFAGLKESICADPASVGRINIILGHVAQHFSIDTAKFAIGALDFAGSAVLRYSELAYETPERFFIRPRAIFAINCPIDLIGLWHWSEREIKKNFFPGEVGDAKYIQLALTSEFGTINDNLAKYVYWSPFFKDTDAPGNERFLKTVPLRLYYDTDINWELKNRRDSYYDTHIPDGSELISRLMLLGNDQAQFVSARQPGVRSNGMRSPDAWSIVDETDCVQWMKRKLDIFDPNFYEPQYQLPIPAGWNVEHLSIPIDFAPQIPYRGVEDIRFAPGWGDKTSEQYWSYCFLWWLDADAVIDGAGLQKDLQDYYSGLIGRNIVRRKIPKEKLFTTTVAINKIKAMTGDAETYTGTIKMLDYMAQEPMVLRVTIHKRSCPDRKHIALFTEISPKPSTHGVWQIMDSVWSGFQCNN